MVKVNPRRKSKVHPGANEPEKSWGRISSPRPSTSYDVRDDGLNNYNFDPESAKPEKTNTMALKAAER